MSVHIICNVVAAIYILSCIVYTFMSKLATPQRTFATYHAVLLVSLAGAVIYGVESLDYGRFQRVRDDQYVFAAHFYFEALQYGTLAVIINYRKGFNFAESFFAGALLAGW